MTFVERKVKELAAALNVFDLFAHQVFFEGRHIWGSHDLLPIDLDIPDGIARDGREIVGAVPEPADDRFYFGEFWHGFSSF
jgi:hypothetical protein